MLMYLILINYLKESKIRYTGRGFTFTFTVSNQIREQVGCCITGRGGFRQTSQHHQKILPSEHSCNWIIHWSLLASALGRHKFCDERKQIQSEQFEIYKFTRCDNFSLCMIV